MPVRKTVRQYYKSAPDIPRLYLIGTIAELPVPLARKLVRIAASSMVPFAIQLRDQAATDRDLYEHGRKLAKIAPLFVNGRPHVAQAARAAGVHLGLHTLPVADVRKFFPALRIGFSAHSAAELAAAAAADFALLSPFARSLSKRADSRQPLGAATFGKLAMKSPVPVLALGGITPANAPEALHSWAAGIAVSGTVFSSSDPVRAFTRLIEVLD